MAYIPEQHIQYDLLPACRKSGREVFSYPNLQEIEEYIPDENDRTWLTPYGYRSYPQYFRHIDSLISRYGTIGSTYTTLGKRLVALKLSIFIMNQKKAWSVLQYIGNDTPSIFGLTHKRHYYWPCSIQRPMFEGVIDDEEFTSYRYSVDPALWVIKEDPLGMAARTLQRYSQQHF